VIELEKLRKLYLGRQFDPKGDLGNLILAWKRL